MADKKITQLNELLVAGASDVFAIVDLTPNETKKITVSNLMGTPGPIGIDTPSSGEFTTLDLSAGVTVSEISNDSTADEVYQLLTASAIQQSIQASAGAAVLTPSSDNRMARYDGTEAIQGTGITIDDSDNITGVNTYNIGSDNALRFPVDNSNIAVGALAGNALTVGGNRNIAIGNSAMATNASGDENIVIGYLAGDSGNGYLGNTIIGSFAARALTSGGANVTIGHGASGSNQTGSSNVVIGYSAGAGFPSFSYVNNVFIGYVSAFSMKTGHENVFIGQSSGYFNETGFSNIVIGQDAGRGSVAASYSNCIIIGKDAGHQSSSGADNVLIGQQSSYSITSGIDNAVVGCRAAYYNQTGNYNVIMGREAGFGASGNSHSNNVFIGYQSAYSITTGGNNVFVGHSAGYSNTTIGDNTYVGFEAGYENETGQYNTMIGTQAGKGVVGNNHQRNTFVGYQAGYSITAASFNVMVGYSAGVSNITGNNNVVIGDYASRYSEAGQANVLIGKEAGYGVSGNSHSFNTFLGYQSGYSVTTGSNNTLVGHQAGYATLTGNTNAFLGYNSGRENSTGSGNVYIGYNAGRQTVSGASNVCIGREAGEGVAANSFNNNVFIGWRSGHTATTGGFNVAVGSEAGYSNLTGASNVFIGRQAGYNETGSNRLYIQNVGSAPPLIYGEFDNNLVKINGDLDITGEFTFDTTGIAVSEISDDSTASEIYQLLTASAIQQSIRDPFTGYLLRSIFTYVDADEIYVDGGVYHHQGTSEQFVYWDSQLTVQLSGAGTDTWYYLYLDDSAIVTAGTNLLTATELIFSSTPPTWDGAKKGRYNGLDRCIFGVLTDGSNNILEFFHESDMIYYADEIEDLAMTDIDDSWADVTLTIPAFCCEAEIQHHLWNNGSSSNTICSWRTNGQTGATGKKLGLTDADGPGRSSNTLRVLTDPNRIIEIIHTTTGNQSSEINTQGWYFPTGM